MRYLTFWYAIRDHPVQRRRLIRAGGSSMSVPCVIVTESTLPDSYTAYSGLTCLIVMITSIHTAAVHTGVHTGVTIISILRPLAAKWLSSSMLGDMSWHWSSRCLQREIVCLSPATCRSHVISFTRVLVYCIVTFIGFTFISARVAVTMLFFSQSRRFFFVRLKDADIFCNI